MHASVEEEASLIRHWAGECTFAPLAWIGPVEACTPAWRTGLWMHASGEGGGEQAFHTAFKDGEENEMLERIYK